jgi:hypothetical protein
MPNESGAHLELRVIVSAPGHPGLVPRRISAELARTSGATSGSEHGVWRVPCRVGLNTRSKRLALIARHRHPSERRLAPAPPERHIEAFEPGEKVPRDGSTWGECRAPRAPFWQYTAIGVASSSRGAAAEIGSNPRPRTPANSSTGCPRTQQASWRLREVGTDNGSEFRSKTVRRRSGALSAASASSKASPPSSNGCVERLWLTILEEC